MNYLKNMILQQNKLPSILMHQGDQTSGKLAQGAKR
jgi:hypothetical protein